LSRIILDLCGGTGSWSEPYRAAGYDVRLITLPDCDVRDYTPPPNVHGILAAPPCTEFASSGARWWAGKPPELLAEAVEVAYRCLAIIQVARPVWWALENPVGRLYRVPGPYRYTFQPWQFGDPWLKRSCVWGSALQPTPTVRSLDPELLPTPGTGFKSKGGRYKSRLGALNEAANGRHNNPAEYFGQLIRDGVIPADWIHRLGPSPNRATLRSVTPPGFARAFFQANP
jgi:hypothetical protein